MVAIPLSGAARPSSIRKVVVLPAPFGPRNPVTRPGPTSKLRPSTAVTGPYRLVKWSIFIIWLSFRADGSVRWGRLGLTGTLPGWPSRRAGVAVLFTAPAGAGTGPGRRSHDIGTAGPAAWSHDRSAGDRSPAAASSAAAQLASGRGGGQ